MLVANLKICSAYGIMNRSETDWSQFYSLDAGFAFEVHA